MSETQNVTSPVEVITKRIRNLVSELNLAIYDAAEQNLKIEIATTIIYHLDGAEVPRVECNIYKRML